jgi:hypothetical protein
LKHGLLDAEVEEIQNWKSRILSTGLITLTGDGWSKVCKVGCSNVEAVTRHGAVHISTHARGADTIEKNAEYTANIFVNAIHDLGGPEKVIGICTDNDSTMRAVWDLVESQVKGIVAVPCVAHVSNLLMKDIGNIHWISVVIDAAKHMNIWVRNHSFLLALLRSKKETYPEL